MYALSYRLMNGKNFDFFGFREIFYRIWDNDARNAGFI
jgi:hypothetical protein